MTYFATEQHYGRSTYGSFNVEKGAYSPLRETFISAGKEFGFQEMDFNGPQKAGWLPFETVISNSKLLDIKDLIYNTTGFGPMEYSTKSGGRVNTYTAFLQNAESRANLRIERYSQAIKVVKVILAFFF